MNEYERSQAHGLTSQDAVAQIGNRFDLVLVAAQRVRELADGAVKMTHSRHGHTLTALKEIEEGLVGREYLLKVGNPKPKRR